MVNGDVVPSFVYRAVLDFVATNYRDQHILLAPANKFGLGISEQECARRYLLSRGLNPTSFEHNSAQYIDTFDNLSLLIQYLHAQDKAIQGNSMILCGIRHQRRVAAAAKLLGMSYGSVLGVDYHIPRDEKIVRRLWYYKFPRVHNCYEAIATLYQAVKFRISDMNITSENK